MTPREDGKVAAHTPGKWTGSGVARKTSNWDATYRHKIFAFEEGGLGPTVAYALGKTRAECEANAHLISAAPDLLAACEAIHAAGIVPFAAEKSETPRGRDNATFADELLRAAISKSRGESKGGSKP